MLIFRLKSLISHLKIFVDDLKLLVFFNLEKLLSIRRKEFQLELLILGPQHFYFLR